MSSTITLTTVPVIHLPRSERVPPRVRWAWLGDGWLVATFVSATIASIASWWYAFTHHFILLYGDAHAHLDLARRVFDNATPGLAQLGGVWLPLPHLIMLPFVWNDFLWRTGLAGSFSSMPCYIIAALYIYLSARRLTHDSRASFVGTLVFILNPNILYLQTTPLSEMVLMATMAIACYYFLAWSQDDRLSDLVKAAGATFLATLARYDGWALLMAMVALIVIIGLRKRHQWLKIQNNLLVFGALGSLGGMLWFLWNLVIFGNPLYFQSSQYSAQSQQSIFINEHLDETYHNLWLTIHDYGIVIGSTVGRLLLILGAIALLCYFLRRRFGIDMLAATIFLVPLAFYMVSLYSGQSIIFAPGAAPRGISDPLFNARYGIAIITSVAIFLATLVMRWPLGQIALTGVIIVQTIVIAQTGIITLQDGQYGISCFPYSPILVYLDRHYNSGLILQGTYKTGQDFAKAHIDLKYVIYQGSGSLWKQALHDPASVVAWIIVSKGDLVSQHIDIQSAAFLSQFTPIIEDPNSGEILFHRNGLAPLPTRAISPDLANNYFAACGSVGNTTSISEPHPLAVQPPEHRGKNNS